MSHHVSVGVAMSWMVISEVGVLLGILSENPRNLLVFLETRKHIQNPRVSRKLRKIWQAYINDIYIYIYIVLDSKRVICMHRRSLICLNVNYGI